MQLIIESPDEKVIEMILEMIRPFNVTFQEVKTINAVAEDTKQKKITKRPAKRVRILGIMPGLVTNMPPDFNAPLEDFADYMH